MLKSKLTNIKISDFYNYSQLILEPVTNWFSLKIVIYEMVKCYRFCVSIM